MRPRLLREESLRFDTATGISLSVYDKGGRGDILRVTTAVTFERTLRYLLAAILPREVLTTSIDLANLVSQLSVFRIVDIAATIGRFRRGHTHIDKRQNYRCSQHTFDQVECTVIEDQNDDWN